MRVAVLIRALGAGGAERQLVVLARGLAKKGHDVGVITFHGDGVFERDLAADGIAVDVVRKAGRWDIIGAARRLARMLNTSGVEVVYSSMPAANLLSVAARVFGARQAMAWRLAASDMDLSRYDWFSAAAYRLEALCSGMPKVIIANSRSGRDAAKARGYPEERLKVVLNGIDTSAFRPDRGAGASLARRWGLDGSKRRIGMVARGDPKKGHDDFLEAVRLFPRDVADVEFLCIGAGPGSWARDLEKRVRDLGIADRVVLRDFERDMTAVYNTMDLNTLSSRFGEGFPNAVGEAMACGVPCVVTDCGDSAEVVGDTGEVVPRGSPPDIVRGWQRLLQRLERDGPGVREGARRRVVDNFSAERCVDETEKALLGVID